MVKHILHIMLNDFFLLIQAQAREVISGTSVRRQYLQRSASSHELREFNTTHEKDNRQEKWDSAQANASDLQCIECIQAVPVFSLEELEVGDHVVFDRKVYTHHGIIVSENRCGSFKIIEATNTTSGFVSATSTSKSFGGKAEIMCSLKKLDLRKEKNISCCL